MFELEYLVAFALGASLVAITPIAASVSGRESRLTKAISGSLLKGGLQYIATDSVRGENDTVRSVLGVGSGILAQATTRADLRSWSTLPKLIRFCKIPTPTDKKLTIQSVGTNFNIAVTLKPSLTNLVFIRSISSYTPLKLVGQISIDP